MLTRRSLPHAARVAPMTFEAQMREAEAHAISPCPGASLALLVEHLNTVLPLHGRHTAKSTISGRVKNVSAFRALHSDIEVTR